MELIKHTRNEMVQVSVRVNRCGANVLAKAAAMLVVMCGILAGTHVVAQAATSIAAGWTHAVAVRSDGTAWTWGSNYNSNNQGSLLGLNGSRYSLEKTPVQLSGLSGMTMVAADTAHTLALKSDGTVWAWGDNTYGQLGDGTTVASATPIQVPGLSNITRVFACGSASFAVAADGSVKSWGNNANGQLGDGATTSSSSPRAMTALAGAVSIASSGERTFMVKNDGTVWGWGQYSSIYGNIGDGTTSNRTSPTQISSLTGATMVAAGLYHAVVVKSDGTVWAWGDNFYGSLGNGSANTALAPVQSNISGVTAVAVVGGATLALKTDGSVWAWGYNGYQVVGDGTTASRFSPQQIAGLNDVAAISGTNVYALAMKNDGTVWAWGENYSGALGDGLNNDFRSCPEYVLATSAGGAFDLLPDVPNGTLPVFPVGVNGRGLVTGLTLSLDLSFTGSDVGQVRNIYLAAAMGSTLFLHNGSTWGVYGSGEMPAYATASTNSYINIPILASTDATGLAGVVVYLGYGSNANEMLSAGRFRQVYVVPAN